MKIKELITEEVALGKYLYHITNGGHLINILKDGHLGYPGEITSMTADRHYSVTDKKNTAVQIILDANKVKQLRGFEKHMDNWEWDGPGTGTWAKDPDGPDTESEYRLIDGDAVPLSHFLAIRLATNRIPDDELEEIEQLARQKNITLIKRPEIFTMRNHV